MNANLWTQLLIAIVPALITGVGSLIIAIKKCKNEINTLETNNKHEIEKLMKQHKIDIEALNEKHLERIAKDPEFIALNEDLKIRDERRERKFLSLNFQERKAENDKDDARRLKDLNDRFKREGKKALKDIDDLPKDYEAPDFFLKEAEKMAADLVKLNANQQKVDAEIKQEAAKATK